jgi:uncharacterized protein
VDHFTPTADAPPPRLRLLVLQPTPFCNIDCRYCYLPERTSTARMSLATLALACRRVFEGARLDRRLEVAWHAGEPLTVPLPWYAQAFELMARHAPPLLALTHRFQTNGLLLDADWARFIKRTGAHIGLSIDGPAHLHDANRRTRGGRGTHADAMRAVRLLQDHGVAFQVITVLTRATLDDPDGLFEFYRENGIRDVGFNIEEIEAAHTASSLDDDAIAARFQRFIARFFTRAWHARGEIRLRELEDATALILSDDAAQDEQNLPFAIVSVAHDGAMSTFSPELLGARHPRFASFAFGNVATHSLPAIARTRLFQAISSEIRRGVQACEQSCRYFRWCGGGAPANKLFETGRFDATETMHCRLTRQIVLEEALAGLETGFAAAGTHNHSFLSPSPV